MKYYVIEESCGTAMGGPDTRWEDGKIYSSVDKALKSFKKYPNEKMTIRNCTCEDYFSSNYGFIKEITIQDTKEWYRKWIYFIKEVEVE